jgi:glycosyltransferase involved in cell wall biosynthesis
MTQTTEYNVVSVIIPAYNEAAFIVDTIESVREHLEAHHPCEIIVADHGSTDQTVTLSRAAGASVLVHPEAKTIGALRNLAVAASCGSVLLFLDADTSLTADWAEHFPGVLRELQDNPLLLTGAKRGVPPTASWISRLWFRSPPDVSEPTHLGGGHIIMNRALFDAIEGFPEDLETGEDYEFCMRARRHRATIVSRPTLLALHRGVPKTVEDFFAREIWHGRGDWLNWRVAVRSKVALVSLAFLVLHGVFIVLLIGDAVGAHVGIAWPLAAAGGIVLICAGSAALQFPKQPLWAILGNVAVYYIYYWARAVSLFSVLKRRAFRRHERRT